VPQVHALFPLPSRGTFPACNGNMVARYCRRMYSAAACEGQTLKVKGFLGLGSGCRVFRA